MTDNEIIKALECMCEQIIGDCDECQFYKHIDDDCSKYVIEPSLDLINRQKAEIERLEKELENERGLTLGRQSRNLALKAENERLKTLNSKLEAEVFMQRENDAIHTEAEDEDWFLPLKTIDDIKAEAIKEFANDLYKKFDGHSDYHGDTILTKIVCMAEGQKVDVAKPLDTDDIKIKAIKEFAEDYKDQIKNYTGMFTDDGFFVSLEAVLSAVDFILNKKLEETEGDQNVYITD